MQKSIFKILLVLLIVPIMVCGAINDSGVEKQFNDLRSVIRDNIKNGNFAKAQALLSQAQSFLIANHNPVSPRLSDNAFGTMLANLMRNEAVVLYVRTRQWEKAANSLKIASKYNYKSSDAIHIRTFLAQANGSSVAYTANVVNTATPRIDNRTALMRSITAKNSLINRLVAQRRFAEAQKVYADASRQIHEGRALLGNVSVYNRLRATLLRTWSHACVVQGDWKKAEIALINAQRLDYNRFDASRLEYVRKRLAESGQNAVNVPALTGAIDTTASLPDAVINGMANARTFFTLRFAFERIGYSLMEQEQNLLQQKLQIAREMSGSGRLSSSQLTDMQAKLREIDGKLASIGEQRANSQREYIARKNNLNLRPGLGLTNLQSTILMDLGLKVTRMKTANSNLSRMIAESLANVSVTSEVTWGDLRGNFETVQKAQLVILELKSKLSALVNKSPISEAEQREAAMLKDLLEKAMEASDSAMEKIQSEFANAESFGKLSASEKIEYISLFKDVWLKEKEVNESSPTAEELFKFVNGSEESSTASAEENSGTASETSASGDTIYINTTPNTIIYINKASDNTSAEGIAGSEDAGAVVSSSGDEEDL